MPAQSVTEEARILATSTAISLASVATTKGEPNPYAQSWLFYAAGKMQLGQDLNFLDSGKAAS